MWCRAIEAIEASVGRLNYMKTELEMLDRLQVSLVVVQGDRGLGRPRGAASRRPTARTGGQEARTGGSIGRAGQLPDKGDKGRSAARGRVLASNRPHLGPRLSMNSQAERRHVGLA